MILLKLKNIIGGNFTLTCIINLYSMTFEKYAD